MNILLLEPLTIKRDLHLDLERKCNILSACTICRVKSNLLSHKLSNYDSNADVILLNRVGMWRAFCLSLGFCIIANILFIFQFVKFNFYCKICIGLILILYEGSNSWIILFYAGIWCMHNTLLCVRSLFNSLIQALIS